LESLLELINSIPMASIELHACLPTDHQGLCPVGRFASQTDHIGQWNANIHQVFKKLVEGMVRETDNKNRLVCKII
jgi:hypothetical protein